jgi:hypothetical protein
MHVMDTLLITLISLFSNLTCQIHYLKSTISTFFWSLITQCVLIFFLLVDILTSLSFARR